MSGSPLRAGANLEGGSFVRAFVRYAEAIDITHYQPSNRLIFRAWGKCG